MDAKHIMIYGAYGYTGELMLEEALKKGLKPIAAGRNKEKTEAIAQKYGVEARVFGLEDPLIIEKQLLDIKVLLHAAGPFQFTSVPMVEACLTTQTHYVDITGEIWVFEKLQSYDEAAKKAGIMLLPGAGFDVVPTDSLASYLASKMPDATHLELAFTGLGAGASRGTSLTAVENLDKKNLVRENGKLKEVPQGHASRAINFGDFTHHCVSIPWGDVSTAYVSTGIPNVMVYMGLKPKIHRMMKWSNWLRPILKTNFVKNRLRKRIENGPAGPTEEQRQKGRSFIWGEVRNAKGDKLQARLESPEGYSLTAWSSVEIGRRIFEEDDFKTGFQTPSKAYGMDFVLEMKTVERIDMV
jgi:short subunit dehydrogenase-like uncharacterized protein